MNKVRLLSTVAAALLFAAGAASAQEMKKNESPTPAPAAQQKAPAEKVAPNMHAGDRKMPETTGQATSKAPDTEKSPTMNKGEMNKGEMNKGEMNKTEMNKSEKGTAPHAAAKESTNSNEKAQVQSNEKSGATAKSTTTEQSRTTTGQGAAAGAAKLTTEQRTKITAVFREHKVAPTHLNVSVSVGTRIPASVHFYPVPTEVITIYPEWRGYDYILVGDEIVIISPSTHEIVAVIAA